MNQQEAFDKALNGVRAQGYRKATRGGGCRYFVEQGLRCGVGHMLSEEVAKKAEGSVRAVIDGHYRDSLWSAPMNAELAGLGADFLASCQSAHDQMLGASEQQSTVVIEGFESYMRSIAADYGLTYTAPVQS